MSAPLQNDLLLRALLRQPTPRTPLWMMRQAGRYLPEYRATRAKAGSFLNLCMNPELACEVTLQPLARYRLDAAILFSDILTIPHAMNVGLEFEAGEGPKIARPVRTSADIDRLPMPEPEGELRYVMDAVRLIRRELGGRVPLIGFAGSPWTVGTYMVEGGGSKNFQHIKGMLYGAPAELHRLLGHITCATLGYLNAQVAAGAQAVMVFDTWGGALTPADYREFSLRYLRQIVEGVTRESEGRPVPRVADSGSAPWRTPAATRSAWTGPATSPTHVPPCRTASRCRATSTRACSMRRPPRSAPRWRAYSRATAAATATSSTSVTASTPTCRRSTRWRWSRPCTS